MLTRAFSVLGLIVRIAEWKVHLLAFAARRSAIAMLGYLIAAVVAFGGMAFLLGAGYVAIEAIVGVSIAMAAVGVFLLIVACLIWIFAERRGRSAGQSITEHDAWENVARDEELLRSKLGMNNNEAKADDQRAEPRAPPSRRADSVEGLDDPMVVIAAGFAMLGMLGPGRLFRAVRMTTALASVAALANRALNEHRDTRGAPDTPVPPESL